MPHLIDKNTGICVICNRKDFTELGDDKSFDLRELAIDCINDTDDSKYRALLEHYYLKPKNSFIETKEQEPFKKVIKTFIMAIKQILSFN